MPKMKTNSGAKKRFVLTGTGKVKRRHAYHSQAEKEPQQGGHCRCMRHQEDQGNDCRLSFKFI